MSIDVEAQLSDLKQKVENMQPGGEPKLSMIVFSGELDKLLAAMIIATGARAMGVQVVQFFTFWGTAALREPSVNVGGKDFMSKMFGWMLPKGRNKLKLSNMHMAGMGTAMMKDLMRKKNAPSLDQLFEIAAQLGVQIKVCEMSMDLMGFKREEMIEYPNLEFCGVATFLAEAKESSIQLFI
ncbi:DsrE/DsrF/DrsH-like family protein [Candidatus Eisenbacteria bacterium]|uniref:DsrE/DsrF/DrsH-like family protein n=1 Tax=Eiseniibacteriota bacterium TaxID=2212470 RepID=A0ABV6YJH6_UNCEI